MQNDDFLNKNSDSATAKTYLSQARMNLLFHYVEADPEMMDRITRFNIFEDNSVEAMEVRDDVVVYNQEYVRGLVPKNVEDVGLLAKAYIDLIYPENDFAL